MDAVAIVAWFSGEKGDKAKPGTTTYKVQHIVKGPKSLMKDSKITVAPYRAAKAGDLFLMLGTKGDGIEWGSPIEVTETTFEYISRMPPLQFPVAARLAYYATFLENAEPDIADDAILEFTRADFDDLVAIAKDLPRDKLRKWVAAPETSGARLGQYAMMLGLCGTADDATLLERKMLAPTDDLRLHNGDVMVGYLLLTHEQGLAVIDREIIESKDVPFRLTLDAKQALSFMWSHGKGRIERERLSRSMRGLLERPQLADVVIFELARWKDWTVHERLMEIYDSEEFNAPSVKRAIVRYLLVCSRDVATTADGSPNPYAADAKQLLEGLRKKDPKTVSEAERFFVSP